MKTKKKPTPFFIADHDLMQDRDSKRCIEILSKKLFDVMETHFLDYFDFSIGAKRNVVAKATKEAQNKILGTF